jgi:nucleotide-binding universal stress UspA family protein
MPQIGKILFPVDFSDSCVGAARHVAFFAGQFEAEIMLLHVVTMGEHNLASELLPGRQAQLNAFLTSELKYFTAHRVCVTGDPPSAIAECARSWNPDLVMIPTHGLGYFRRHLLGSITAKALHDLSCPMWTSIHAETAPALEEIHCRRILCAVDLCERSGCILGWAAWLAGEYQASLAIVNATPQVDATASGWYLEEEFRRYVSEKAEKEIGALQAQTSTASRVYINPGDPAEVIANAARDFGADLLVIGRHGAAGLAGALLQNAYAIIRESPCPVISI